MRVLLLVLLLAVSRADEDLKDYGETWQAFLNASIHNPLIRESFLQAAEEEKFSKGLDIRFDCDIEPSPAPPRTVHELRPGDIGVVASVGDSITSGNGIGWEVFLQRRGESWCIGGNKDLDSKVYTLTNLLRKWNPDVQGYSYGITNSQYSPNARFNQAVGGAMARHMPIWTERLIGLMKEDELIDFENDWKIFTIFIGGNDLCQYCFNRPGRGPEAHRDNIRDALDMMHAQVPRMLVNVVPMFDVTPLTKMSKGLHCDALHLFFCFCAVWPFTKPELRPVQLGYYELVKELIDSGRYDTRDDFTVVMQPSMVDMEPPVDPDTGKYDKSWLSTDCFHPARKGHHLMAATLWNTMLIPVGQKPLVPPVDMDDLAFSCPTPEKPYFFTNKNSGLKEEPRRNDKPEVAAFGVGGDDAPAEDDQHSDDSAAHSHRDNSVSNLGVAGIVVGAVVGMVLVGALTVGVLLPIFNSRRTESGKKEDETDASTLEEHDMAAIIVPSS